MMYNKIMNQTDQPASAAAVTSTNPTDPSDTLPNTVPNTVADISSTAGDTPSPTPTQDNTMREKVQSEVVRIITRGLEAGTINEDRARSIAKLILEKLPEDIKLQELMEVIPQLDDEFTELSDVVVPIMTEYEEKVRTVVTDKVMRLIQARKFQIALKVTREALEYSKKLS